MRFRFGLKLFTISLLDPIPPLRSASKKLWTLFWSNSFCSHPREGENINEAVSRRLHDELGISAFDIEYVY